MCSFPLILGKSALTNKSVADILPALNVEAGLQKIYGFPSVSLRMLTLRSPGQTERRHG